MSRLTLGCCLVLLACGEAEEQWPTSDPPDVTGRYNVVPGGTTGCDGDPTWITGWAEGPLEISGSPDDLTFSFTGMTFYGSVDGDRSFNFGGTGSWGANELSVYNEGVFTLEDDRWLLDGDFDVIVYDPEFSSEDCTVTGPVKAYQLSR